MSSDSLHPYQNLPPGDLLTRQVTQDLQVLMNQNASYLGTRFQIPVNQNPIAMLQQTGSITYPTQNITQSNAQIYAQQQMPTGAKVQANQSIPLGLDGPYAHQSLQPMRPMSNPRYDAVPLETMHTVTVETHGETKVKENGAKRGRDSETPDESKATKRKGQKLNNEEETEKERGSNRNEIERLHEEMRKMREEYRGAREQGPFFKDHEKDIQSKQESEKQQQQQRQQQQQKLLLQQQMLGQQQQQRHQGQQQP
jgi:hypothetical protein